MHVHIYYMDMRGELRSYLENLDSLGCSCDLYVTMMSEDEALIKKIRHFHPGTQIRKVANRGYDAGSFVEVLNEVDLSQYSYLIKLHTKRDIYRIPEPGRTKKFPYNLYSKRWGGSLLSFMKKATLKSVYNHWKKTASWA